MSNTLNLLLFYAKDNLLRAFSVILFLITLFMIQ